MLTVTKEQMIQRALDASVYIYPMCAERMAREVFKDAQPETEDATIIQMMDDEIEWYLKQYVNN